MKDYKLYVIHIIEQSERIAEYCKGDREYFLSDMKTQDSVLRALQTLSESATKLPDEVKSKYPDIPWKEIAGFRNIIVHNYLNGINLERVWTVIDYDIPPLVKVMQKEMNI